MVVVPLRKTAVAVKNLKNPDELDIEEVGTLCGNVHYNTETVLINNSVDICLLFHGQVSFTCSCYLHLLRRDTVLKT